MVLLFLLTYCKKKKIELHKNSDVLKVTFFFSYIKMKLRVVTACYSVLS